MKPPTQFFRVEALIGYGWPECTRQERRERTFLDAQAVADYVAVLARIPTHHRLLSIIRTTTPLEWEQVDVDTLPAPRDLTNSNEEGAMSA